MAKKQRSRPQARPFWSGTLSFGLVSVPVDLYAAVKPRRLSMRMLGPDGQPLARRYVCSADGEELDSDDIVRGYPVDGSAYIEITDEELESLQPRKSRDIDLRRFVPRDEINPMLFERPYILAPSGDSAKAYHLLADAMEQSERAGIATFVMRGKEYLVAILAEGGLLRAETLRFADELRDPNDIVALSQSDKAPTARRRDLDKAIKSLEADELDEELLRDRESERIYELAETKRAENRDVVEVEAGPRAEQDDTIVDLMSILKERMGTTSRSRSTGKRRSHNSKGGKATASAQADLEQFSKSELYERAQKLDIPGRSSMTKDELLRALRKAG